MQAYREGVNVDRLVSFAALVAFAKVQQANRGYKKSVMMKMEQPKTWITLINSVN